MIVSHGKFLETAPGREPSMGPEEKTMNKGSK